MRISDINKIKNKDYVVLLPACDYDIKDSVEHSFDNVFYLDYEPSKEDVQTLIDFVNNKGNQLVLFDYSEFYRLVLPHVRKTKKVKWVYKNNFAEMTNGGSRATFTNLMEFYDRNIVDVIGCLDYSTYQVLKHSKFRVKHLILDINKKNKKTKKFNSIGIIGNDYNPNHNVYNQLSALKLVNDYDYVKLIGEMKELKGFVELFGIRAKLFENTDKDSHYNEIIKTVMSDNYVNLYCNFTANNTELVLKSMDAGTPCILGNTDLFDKFPKIKKCLVLQSDDDINEIADKIRDLKVNEAEILKEYEKFRIKYSKESNISIINFLS